MKINKFIIPKEFLNSMSEDEKMFAVLLGYFVNEINMLYKCIRIKVDLFLSTCSLDYWQANYMKHGG